MAATTCKSLRTATYPDVRITAADDIAPGQLWAGAPPAGPFEVRVSPAKAFCRVQGVIETEIGFELWLPRAEDWNGRFLGAGVGGDAGAFNYADLPRGIDRGYAAATTDTGHKAADRTWMLGDPERLRNFEYRAHHLLAVKAKQVVADFYGNEIDHAYFIGCSGGGRQGLKEMQRFPEDYDGILVGAAGPKTPEMTTRRMWELLLRDHNPGLMAPEDWKLVQQHAIDSCDALDGVADGIAEDPRKCGLNLETLACTGDKTAQCLMPEQITFARKFYEPMLDEDGRAIDSGLLPGVLIDSGRSRLAPATFGQAVRKQADWDGNDFSVRDDLAAIDRVMPDLRADDADLRPFAARGGRFIQYSGWMDPAVSTNMITEYHEAVAEAVGGQAAADEFSRLYMLPGMYHCGGGPGADRIGGAGRDAPIVDTRHDLLRALEEWVEQGKAPGPMVASKVEDGEVVRTHLICPFPQTAHFTGGSADDADNYQCQ
ncbi:MAG: tannase/feruloyl esterase family alpha/beta hydrolase [Gammaproteobacteria bacterium]|nr:tannase/feruloyl esterase family alpha/beta hydrolase [Gammaproteobacteria bacterium]